MWDEEETSHFPMKKCRPRKTRFCDMAIHWRWGMSAAAHKINTRDPYTDHRDNGANAGERS
jgi:hypothetical protein